MKKKKLYCKQKVCHIYKKGFSANDDNKNIKRLEVIVIILKNIEELVIIFAI